MQATNININIKSQSNIKSQWKFKSSIHAIVEQIG